jgi:hypothetical protein
VRADTLLMPEKLKVNFTKLDKIKFRHFGTAAANKRYIHNKINDTIYSEHSVNIKVKF